MGKSRGAAQGAAPPPVLGAHRLRPVRQRAGLSAQARVGDRLHAVVWHAQQSALVPRRVRDARREARRPVGHERVAAAPDALDALGVALRALAALLVQQARRRPALRAVAQPPAPQLRRPTPMLRRAAGHCRPKTLRRRPPAPDIVGRVVVGTKDIVGGGSVTKAVVKTARTRLSAWSACAPLRVARLARSCRRLARQRRPSGATVDGARVRGARAAGAAGCRPTTIASRLEGATADWLFRARVNWVRNGVRAATRARPGRERRRRQRTPSWCSTTSPS
jgi:hypothetical protein